MKEYPFKFLNAYRKEDAGFFFGRDQEINDLYEMMFQSPILLVYGASGTGKTSLIQCGLASKFAAHDWLALPVRCGLNINANLKNALDVAGGVLEQAAGKPSWLDALRVRSDAPAGRPLNYFDKAFKAIYLESFKPVYLIFDQFEELFIWGPKDEQDKFIASVVQILQVAQPVKMIFAIREEYLGSLSEFEKAVPQLFAKKLRVEPMNGNKVRQVIIGATQHENSLISLKSGEEEKIAKGIFNKIKGEGKLSTIQLPYLQVFLDKLYLEITGDETRQSEAVFTLAALDKMHDIGDILENFLDGQVAGISKKQGTIDPLLTTTAIWRILSPFAALDGTKEPIDKRDLYHKLPEIAPASIDAVIEAFITGRILKHNEDVDLYELAHDALAKRIAEKRSDEEIALLEIKRLIKIQTSIKEDSRELFSERQLTFFEPYLAKLDLSAEEMAWIAKSSKAVEEKKELAKLQLEKEKHNLWDKQLLLVKNQRSQQLLIRWMAGALALVICLLILAFPKKNQARAAAAEIKSARDSLKKATKTIKAFYFYKGKLALAYNGNLFGYVNKNGMPVIPYEYDHAENFAAGFAKVKRQQVDYLVDSAGNEYRVAYGLTPQLPDDITALDLRNQNPGSFPANLAELKNLQVLILSGHIDKIPDDLSPLKNLKFLVIANAGLPDLPPSIGQLRSLTSLNLSKNEFTELPIAISRLTNLTSLDLSKNQITDSIAGIGALEKLTSLDLSKNQLRDLPAAIGQLTNLTSLDLSKNQLKDMPPAIGSLRNLTSLDLSKNQIKDLPDIGILQNLNELILTGNPISNQAKIRIKKLLPPDCNVSF